LKETVWEFGGQILTPEQEHLFAPVRVTLRNDEVVLARLLREADADALGDLYESVPLEDARFYLSPSNLNRAQAATEAKQASGPHCVGLVLETSEGAFAGYAYYRWADDNAEKSSFGICIRKDYQGRGAGHALMMHLLEVAGRVGPRNMGLHVQKANQRAFDLYRKMGFEVVHEQVRAAHDCFEEEPEYYMERRVR